MDIKTTIPRKINTLNLSFKGFRGRTGTTIGRRFVTLLKMLLAAFSALFGALGGLLLLQSLTTRTPPASGSEASIYSMEKIRIGNTWQYIFIRGKDRNRPMLLFLHGGPGSTAAAHVREFLPELEERFVVVHWEQRGAGKSYAAGNDLESFTVDQLISDTGELSAFLLERYNREKIYLMGASWGTFLGIEAVKRWPQYFHAYIGSGQVVHQLRGERLSNDFIIRTAKGRKDVQTLERMERIGMPPYPTGEHVKRLMEQRGILLGFGGSFTNQTVQKEFSSPWIVLKQREYNILDKVNWVRGQFRSERILGPAFREVNFIETARKLDVPIYIMQGVNDWQTPTSLVEEYFELLVAPIKELHLFDNSGHIPIVEEKAKFLSIVDLILARHEAGSLRDRDL